LILRLCDFPQLKLRETTFRYSLTAYRHPNYGNPQWYLVIARLHKAVAISGINAFRSPLTACLPQAGKTEPPIAENRKIYIFKVNQNQSLNQHSKLLNSYVFGINTKKIKPSGV